MRESRLALLHFPLSKRPACAKLNVQIDEGLIPNMKRELVRNQLTFNELYERYYNDMP